MVKTSEYPSVPCTVKEFEVERSLSWDVLREKGA